MMHFKADLAKYYRIHFGTDRPRMSEKVFLWATGFGLHCVAIYRLGAWVKSLAAPAFLLALPLAGVHKCLSYFMRMIHHVDLEAVIGPGFYISHVGNIHIGPTRIGSNFSITHNVTIGVGYKNGEVKIPRSIGDDVWIGTGSVLSGDCTLCDRVTISSGSILTNKSIPEGALVAGNPARIIQRDYDNRHLFGKLEGN